MKRSLLLILIAFACQTEKKAPMLYQSNSFTLYPNKVVQDSNFSEALSATHLKSNYKSPSSSTYSRLVQFKFSINEKDNELPVGENHWVLIDTEHESPVLTFGKIPESEPTDVKTYLPVNYNYTFKVDMSPVLKQFEDKGYYEAFDGTKIAKTDFKGFYIAGGSEPLSWDFVNLNQKGLKLQPTSNPNIYSITVTLNPYNEANFQHKEWKLQTDISNRPHYSSEQPIVDALFNLSLEEATKNIEADSTLRTGAKWGGVWTRDVSYSTVLAFAYHEPEVAKISLRKKVKRNRIIQDTGSGGAWPVSSDRTTWVLAAWEIYKVTGDEDWLNEIYPIIKNTLEDDYKTLFDAKTGMFSGESSFLDWREQTYPKWMSNMDIYVSENLGTNVVHYQVHKILAEIAKLKGDSNDVYLQQAETIKKGINTYLWQKDKGYYAQYLYGRNNLVASPKFEALGEALSILFDVANKNQAKTIVSKSPITPFGVTCIYPQIPGIPPYHNDAIWPFVQSYWNLAAAKVGNEAVLNQGLASIYRAGGLFLTNYENMVADTGDFLGTEINSDRMLWSMAGNLAMVHRVFMGMSFELDGLYFNPVVPRGYGGKKSLTNFKYRNAVLNITVNGFGNRIKFASMDGKLLDKAFISNDLTGNHTINIELANNTFDEDGINLVKNHVALPTVQTTKEDSILKWKPINGAVEYKIYKNGKALEKTTKTSLSIPDENYASYQVCAVDNEGYTGFLSEPIVISKNTKLFEIEKVVPKSDLPFSNYSGTGFVEVSLEKNKIITLNIPLKKAGNYLLDIRYSNGSGPWNTENKCAIRSLFVNDNYQGVLVFPQRGTDEWSDWGFSNSKKVHLNAGVNKIKISFEDWNTNMNVDINTAMLDYLRIISVD